jgi:hypothetical protein
MKRKYQIKPLLLSDIFIELDSGKKVKRQGRKPKLHVDEWNKNAKNMIPKKTKFCYYHYYF